MCHLGVPRPHDAASDTLSLLLTQLGARTGRAFLERFCQLLVHHAGAERVLVGEILDDGMTVESLALVRGHEVQDNALFERAGIARESSICQTLVDEQNHTIGVLAVITKHRLDVPANVGAAVALLAPRVAGEIARVRADRVAARQYSCVEERLSQRETFLAAVRESKVLLISEEDLTTGEIRFEGDPRAFFGFETAPSRYDPGEWQALIPPSDLEALVAAFTEAMHNKTTFSATYRVRHPDGTMRWILTRGKALFDEQGQARRVVYVNVDVTDQKTLENKLHHAQKLATIGELAAGLGHEVNTPLTIIQGSALQLKRAVQQGRVDSEEFSRKLDLVESTTMRIARLVGRLKGFARLDEGTAEVFDLVDAVAETVQFFAPVYDQMGVNVSFASDAPSAFVRGNRDRFMQLVMNLLSNSRDAVLGCVTKNVRVEVQAAAADVSVNVSDSGVGIPAEQMQRVFEPFYTTKPLGEGLGLGLSICESVVREMDGRLDVRSTQGRGTSFMVVLPKVCGKLPEGERFDVTHYHA